MNQQQIEQNYAIARDIYAICQRINRETSAHVFLYEIPHTGAPGLSVDIHSTGWQRDKTADESLRCSFESDLYMSPRKLLTRLEDFLSERTEKAKAS